VERGSSYSIGLLPAVQFSKFFIQSGLNLRTTRDEGNFQINYNQFLGQYEDVYLVTFDSTENGVIPTYHTQTVDVYDTIDHYVITQASASYSYLEVPLFFGIRKDYKRVSWFIKGGPSCAFIVGRNVPEASLPADQARILNVDRQIPVRTDVSWQFIAATGIDFRFNRRMSFSLEPTFRYYLSPEISSGSYYTGKNPLSIGIRAGLIYNFND
jgi:hypothetical protein